MISLPVQIECFERLREADVALFITTKLKEFDDEMDSDSQAWIRACSGSFIPVLCIALVYGQ